jgi:hypothetical protein
VTIAWNDLEILRIVDEAEQGQRSGIHDGRDLIASVAADGDHVADTQADHESFVRELLVVRDAGLLTWTESATHGREPFDPKNKPSDYLHNIYNFTLSFDGHNAARGRVIVTPLPDPAEDDRRPIASLTLEDVAKCIERRYDSFQTIQLLVEGGISGDREPPEQIGTAAGLMMLFLDLSHGSSGDRRELRCFLGAWLDDALRIGPSDEERDRIGPDLARQGWFVKDGRLVIGEPERKRRATASPAPTLGQLHPIVWEAAAPQWKVQHLPDAVMEAAKAVNAMLEAKVGRSDVSEFKLVTEAFSEKPPTVGARLRFPDIEGDQTRASVTAGVMHFGVGCFRAIRNPLGHLPSEQHDITAQEALEQLAAWSLFARWIERAALTTSV